MYKISAVNENRQNLGICLSCSAILGTEAAGVFCSDLWLKFKCFCAIYLCGVKRFPTSAEKTFQQKYSQELKQETLIFSISQFYQQAVSEGEKTNRLSKAKLCLTSLTLSAVSRARFCRQGYSSQTCWYHEDMNSFCGYFVFNCKGVPRCFLEEFDVPAQSKIFTFQFDSTLVGFQLINCC